MPTIHGKEHKLKDIFFDQFVFTIPSYQRPYSQKVLQPRYIDIINRYADSEEWNPNTWFLSEEYRKLVDGEIERI